MNWRGRICVVLGVLLLVGIPLWYFRPVSLYQFEASLDTHNGYVERRHRVLGYPFWVTYKPTFISKAVGLDETDSGGPWLLVEKFPPDFSPSPQHTILNQMEDIESLLDDLDALPPQSGTQNKFRKQVVESLAILIRETSSPEVLNRSLGHMIDYLREQNKSKARPRGFNLFAKKPRSIHRDEMPDEPTLPSFENDNLGSWQNTLHAPAPSVLNPCQTMRLIETTEDALPQIPKDIQLPPLHPRLP